MAAVHFRLFGLELSPYVLSSAAMLCFIASFYSRYLGFSRTIPHTLVQVVALVALVWAYRRIGGVGYLLWLGPVVVELLLWPRVVIQAVFGVSFWYPFWYQKGYLYLGVFIFGLYLNQDTSYISSQARNNSPNPHDRGHDRSLASSRENAQRIWDEGRCWPGQHACIFQMQDFQEVWD